MKKTDKIENAKTAYRGIRDAVNGDNHSPIDPEVRVDLETGEISVESALTPRDENDISIGRAGDLYDWAGCSHKMSSFSHAQWVELYDQIINAAREAVEDSE